jgi:hypothetical protein
MQPIALETLGPIEATAVDFLEDINRRMSRVTGEDIDSQFLFHRLAVTSQRFNAVLLHDSFVIEDTDPGL